MMYIVSIGNESNHINLFLATLIQLAYWDVMEHNINEGEMQEEDLVYKHRTVRAVIDLFAN